MTETNAVLARDVDALPRVSSPRSVAARMEAADPAMTLASQLLLSTDRAAWLGARLAEQIESDGVRGVVGNSYVVTPEGERIKVGEYARVLFEAERREREHLASLSEKMAKLGLSTAAEQRERETQDIAVDAVQAVCAELGIDLDADPKAMRAARRAIGKVWEARTGFQLTAEQRAAISEP